jgi:hypothetical protein
VARRSRIFSRNDLSTAIGTFRQPQTPNSGMDRARTEVRNFWEGTSEPRPILKFDPRSCGYSRDAGHESGKLTGEPPVGDGAGWSGLEN